MLTISSSWNTRIDFDTFTYHLNGVMTHRRHNTCTLPWRCQNQFQKIHDELPYLFNNSATSTQIQGRPTTRVSYKVGCDIHFTTFFNKTNNLWLAFQVNECFHAWKCWNNYWFWVRANIQSNFVCSNYWYGWQCYYPLTTSGKHKETRIAVELNR